MIFNSIDFAVFLPVVFLCYWFVFNRKLLLQNLFVVTASYVFYGWWDWRFLILMTVTIVCSWASGTWIANTRRRDDLDEKAIRQRARSITVANIVLNLLVLGFFKYYNFFVQNFVEAFTLFGRDLNIHTLKIILPVGISFYTFQALSYSIDVYREKIAPTRDVVSFFAFVSFFPQLVAGPVERATNLLPQFQIKRTFDYAQAVDGMRQILWGLFKKMVVADSCAVAVNDIFDKYMLHSSGALLIGGVLFAFQIYGDFSGYSDIAIGSARLFGIKLMQNFAFPYFSRDIAEFWRRWHISLTTWFRDYVYIPLGGSRVSKTKVVRNTFIIFLLSGLWHGANWTFIAWGAYHALLFVPLLLLGKNRKHVGDVVAENSLFPTLKECLSMLLTFFLVVIGWIIFRAENMHQAIDYIVKMCSLSPFEAIGRKALLLSMILLLVEWLGRRQRYALERIPVRNRVIRRAIYIVIAGMIVLLGGASSPFIYFQF
jgi:D-alanyl-lipoteichoic acid acyltransferase DltB (MBOAT superfamily)